MRFNPEYLEQIGIGNKQIKILINCWKQKRAFKQKIKLDQIGQREQLNCRRK